MCTDISAINATQAENSAHVQKVREPEPKPEIVSYTSNPAEVSGMAQTSKYCRVGPYHRSRGSKEPQVSIRKSVIKYFNTGI